MGPGKSDGQEVMVGEAFVEGIGKTGFPGFGFFRQADNWALRERRRPPEEECESQNQRKAAGCILNRTRESKMEIPV
jgi:hypothetical protein